MATSQLLRTAALVTGALLPVALWSMALAQAAGGRYIGVVGNVVPEDCGGGTITLNVADDGSAVTQVVLDGTFVAGVEVNTVSEPDGPLTVDIAGGLAIAADGSFGETLEVIPGVRGTIDGVFEGTTVSGTLSGPLGCDEIPFSARPDAGGEPARDSGSGTSPWLFVTIGLGVLGVAVVAVVVFLRVRRSEATS